MTRSSGGKGAKADGCCAEEDVHLRRQLGSRQPSAARPHGAPMCVSSHAAASRQGRHTATPGGLRPCGAAAWAAATEAAVCWVVRCRGQARAQLRHCRTLQAQRQAGWPPTGWPAAAARGLVGHAALGVRRLSELRASHVQQQAAGILHNLLDALQEGHGLTSAARKGQDGVHKGGRHRSTLWHLRRQSRGSDSAAGRRVHSCDLQRP